MTLVKILLKLSKQQTVRVVKKGRVFEGFT